MDKDILAVIRNDSLSKHEGATRKYRDHDLDSCKTIIVNRPVNAGPIKVAFEEHDGYGHGLNVPQDWLTEDHIGREKISCPKCKGPGKIIIDGEDCTECHGTGMINKEATIKETLQ